MPDPDNPETWTFQVGTSWLGKRDPSLSNDERMANVKKATSDMAEPFRSSNLWMSEDTIVNTDPIAYWVPIPFDSHEGRIALSGDAAHPLPPCKFGLVKTRGKGKKLTGGRSWTRSQSLYT